MTAVDGQRLRLRAQLLEFLKFRVLASQETFFEAWRLPLTAEPPAQAGTPAGGGGEIRWDATAFRAWLRPLWPQGASLADGDLIHALEQARHLYLDPPPRRPEGTGSPLASDASQLL